jgi:hypothetical protein
MIDWSKEQIGPVYPYKGDGVITLENLIGKQGSKEIADIGEIRFHSLGDSGVNHATEAETIADQMASDYQAGAGGLNPAFLFHLGDVIYGPGKEEHYGERFYRPYRGYPGKIIAIPGNHDGETAAKVDQPSLVAFRDNFCAAKAVVPPQAFGSGIYRQTMTQPGVYWMLDAPYVRIIGLYSNCLEDPGFLEGKDATGKEDNSQIDWLGKTLTGIAKNKEKKALIIATHHPPYSQSGHTGSSYMSGTIDDACSKAGVTPDVFLSGHAHNYQRHTRRLNKRQVPYIVAGTGGIGTQKIVPATGQTVANGVTYDAAVEAYGYLFISVSALQLKIEFWELEPANNKAFDAIVLDLKTGTIR